MKTYKIIVTPEAKKQMRRHLAYIEKKLKNHQAAERVYQDFLEFSKKLEITAASIKEPEHAELLERGLKRKNFERHQYFMLFTLSDDTVRITNIFHFREDYIVKL